MLTGVGHVPGLSHVLRWWARRFREGSVVTVRSGLCKGLKWKRHRRYVNGYWLGHYEEGMQKVLSDLLRPGDTFFDVGANAGFFALAAARLVGPSGCVVALDPDPANAASVRAQAELNDMAHLHVEAVAAADHEGDMTFVLESAGDSMGRLSPTGEGKETLTVRATTLDHVANAHGTPDVVKVDVEGAEGLVLTGAASLVASRTARWILELHGPACERDVKDALAPVGYAFRSLDGSALPLDTAWPRHVVALPEGA